MTHRTEPSKTFYICDRCKTQVETLGTAPKDWVQVKLGTNISTSAGTTRNHHVCAGCGELIDGGYFKGSFLITSMDLRAPSWG